jgi:hypothetical protein
MSKVKPISIREIGLNKYLDSTALAHNNQNYENFCFYMKYKVPKTAIGRMFNVNNRDTIKKWAKIYEEETN